MQGRIQGFKGQQIRFGKVGDVDVAADISAVARAVITAVDVDRRATAPSGIEDEGNEMSFRIVGVGAGDVVRALVR